MNASEEFDRYATPAEALAVADRLMEQILDTARMLTPEAWEHAYYQALLHDKWHTGDVALMKEVRLISMRGGPRYRLAPSHNDDSSAT